MNDLISYHNESVFEAAENGDLPLTLLLFGINKSKRKVLIDENNNTLLHSAACCNNIEIIQFINEQTNGNLYHQNKDSESIKLINTKNNKGETPLLLSCLKGNLDIVKELLDLGSNCFDVDNHNNNIFIILAQNNNLVTLHYIYNYISSKFGELKAINLMKTIDCNGNTILDWAANCGNISIVEYIIRTNCININAADINNRGPLHWAVLSNKIEMVKFLVKSSFNPLLNDIKSESPLKMAISFNNIEMINAINLYKQINIIDPIKNIDQKGLICYNSDSTGIMKSNALYCQISNFKVLYSCFHSLYMLLLLLLANIIPVYIYLPLIGWAIISINSIRKSSFDNKNSISDFIEHIYKFINSKEIYVGIWISIIVCIIIYLIAGI
jgi:ankyrin repeat protein